MALPSFTACCYCGNGRSSLGDTPLIITGIQYEIPHKLCSTCRLRFCLTCVSSHPSAHAHLTYTVTQTRTATEVYRPRACIACASLSHSHVFCVRNECPFLICTRCFDYSMDTEQMHEHDELAMTSLPHRESLDRFELSCKGCREHKSFSHCTRCLGVSYFCRCIS
jgi:hypothetical protein